LHCLTTACVINYTFGHSPDCTCFGFGHLRFKWFLDSHGTITNISTKNSLFFCYCCHFTAAIWHENSWNTTKFDIMTHKFRCPALTIIAWKIIAKLTWPSLSYSWAWLWVREVWLELGGGLDNKWASHKITFQEFCRPPTIEFAKIKQKQDWLDANISVKLVTIILWNMIII
jgi:hypothetical protein